MKILGIESASTTASAALIEDGVLLSECTSNYKKTHSETLLPMISEVLSMTETEPKDLDAIAVSAGPGSFTGLRIGAATAKGLAFSLDIPVIPVPTPDAMAYGNFGSAFILCPVMDARRDQIYTGLYEFDHEQFIVRQEASALPYEEQVKNAEEAARETGKRILYLGDGLMVYEAKIREVSSLEPCFAPANVRFQRAASVAALGLKRFREGVRESAESFLPVYLRKSQAEREREAMGLPLGETTI
ncbi:MAG: tRNA (adenosine(37)-N6)-threonylcarbamoyltransferase complex dimerization subunit type 1 TsaB [Lachnospiraceae bacterium]|nr:tRNA (adenosine(37)-N6)-threonylcarbamoyltransferase complex dimerization subunit type 1 TsaB [Lachnospiraceae bacterium]